MTNNIVCPRINRFCQGNLNSVEAILVFFIYLKHIDVEDVTILNRSHTIQILFKYLMGSRTLCNEISSLFLDSLSITNKF